MRAVILVTGAMLAMSACNTDQSAGNATNTGDELAAENIVANDTTSIDAATGEAANMAAETTLTMNDLDNGEDSNAAGDSNATGDDADRSADNET